MRWLQRFKPIVAPMATGDTSWSIDQAAMLDLLPPLLARNKYILPSHSEHMAHFVRHIVAAAFAKISLHGGTPAGYGVLSHETPHPNGETRIRTQLAAAICEFVAAQSPGTSSD